jgi:hypothetical protein
VIAKVRHNLDRELEETLGAAVALGIGQELLQAVVTLALQDGQYSSSLSRRLRTISGLITEYALLVCRPLRFQVRKQIEVLPDDAGIVAASIEIRGSVDQSVEPNGLMLEDCVSSVQNDNVDIVEPRAGQIGEHIQACSTHAAVARHDG